MAIECDRYQWRDRFASAHGPPDPSTRLVLFVLALYSPSFPSQKTIAERTGLSERSVRTHLSLAQKTGWVKISQKARPGKKAWFVHEYAPTVPDHLAEYLRPAEFAGRTVEGAANGAATGGKSFPNARQNLPPISSAEPISELGRRTLEKLAKQLGASK